MYNKHKQWRTGLWLARLALLALALAAAPACLAADKRAASAEGRFLFLIDTSASMSKAAPQAMRAALELLDSSMQGQLRPGDTLGLWMYNDKLNTDAPMLAWAESAKGQAIETLAGAWRRINYSKKSDSAAFIPYLLPLIKDSSTLTVLWMNNGMDPISGTPFDAQINQLHSQYAADLAASGQCFVTVLACRDGEVVDCAVNSSIGPFRLPQARLAGKAPEPAAASLSNSLEAKPKEARQQIVIGPSRKVETAAKTNIPAPSSIVPAALAPAASAPVQAVEKTPPAAAAPTAGTNAAPAVSVLSNTTAEPAAKSPAAPPLPVSVAQTAPTAAPQSPAPLRNEPAQKTESSAASNNWIPWLAAAVSCIAALAITIVFLLQRLRETRGRPSLITESMRRSEGPARKGK